MGGIKDLRGGLKGFGIWRVKITAVYFFGWTIWLVKNKLGGKYVSKHLVTVSKMMRCKRRFFKPTKTTVINCFGTRVDRNAPIDVVAETEWGAKGKDAVLPGPSAAELCGGNGADVDPPQGLEGCVDSTAEGACEDPQRAEVPGGTDKEGPWLPTLDARMVDPLAVSKLTAGGGGVVSRGVPFFPHSDLGGLGLGSNL